MSAPPPRESRERESPLLPGGSILGLSRFAWLLIAAAFAIGLLLFLLLWLDQRSSNDFYRADGAAPTASDQSFNPLPAPLPAGAAQDSASGMHDRDTALQGPQVVEEPLAPPAPLPEQPPQAPDADAIATTPTAIESPAPRYPPAAWRRRESGIVLLRIHVGADGEPYAVDVVDSSRSRLLDRAAVDAVKRWRFEPAQRNGQSVPGQVEVPIAFDASG